LAQRSAPLLSGHSLLVDDRASGQKQSVRVKQALVLYVELVHDGDACSSASEDLHSVAHWCRGVWFVRCEGVCVFLGAQNC
jgi:hypothetical protein